jgi:hypothetical protein
MENYGVKSGGCQPKVRVHVNLLKKIMENSYKFLFDERKSLDVLSCLQP